MNTANPVSRVFGTDLGTPIDRYYIDGFIEQNKDFIRGKVLEVGDDRYMKRFGTGVAQGDVLSLERYNNTVTVLGNLETGENIPTDVYDCFINTQTLEFIFDVKAAIHYSLQLVKPGGTLLITVPGISQISKYEYDRCGEYWRFTKQSVKKLFHGESFHALSVEAHGNFYGSVSFLCGMPLEQMNPNLLDKQDELYQMVITAKVVK